MRIFSVMIATLLFAAAAQAAGGTSPVPQPSPETSPLVGVYAAFGVGPIDLSQARGTAGNLGSSIEGRIGYSFKPAVELYLSVSRDSTSISDWTVSVWDMLACLQVHLLVGSKAMLYVRGGLGLGISGNLQGPLSSAVGGGLAELAGLGVEIRLTPRIALGPELFYKNAELSTGGSSDQIHLFGVQLALAYY